MRRRWVCDASPVIALAKIGQVELLPSLADELMVPEAVAEEIRQGSDDDPARRWWELHGEPQYRVPAEPIAPAVAAWDLGRGESAVLSRAYRRPGWEAIVDDRAARNCGESLGIPLRGTTGVLLLAKREGKGSRVCPLLEALSGAGLHVSGALAAAALRLAQE